MVLPVEVRRKNYNERAVVEEIAEYDCRLCWERGAIGSKYVLIGKNQDVVHLVCALAHTRTDVISVEQLLATPESKRTHRQACYTCGNTPGTYASGREKIARIQRLAAELV